MTRARGVLDLPETIERHYPQETKVPEPAQAKTKFPEARIARRFNVKDSRIFAEWAKYTGNLALKNDGIATVRNVGSIQVIYITKNQMLKMFTHRYPKLGSNDLLDKMRSAAKNYNDFVRGQGDELIKKRNASMEPPKPENYFQEHRWLDAALTIEKILVPVNRNHADRNQKKLGLQFRSGALDLLEYERDVTVDYWREYGFRLDRVEPHASLMSLYWSPEEVAPKSAGVDMPYSVSLNEPSMQVYDMRPPQ